KHASACNAGAFLHRRSNRRHRLAGRLQFPVGVVERLGVRTGSLSWRSGEAASSMAPDKGGHMRALIFAPACFAVMTPTVALAQPATSTATTSAAPAAIDPATQTPARLAAAHDLLLWCIDGAGTLDAALRQSFANVGPQMRAGLQAQTWFQ